MSNGTDLATRLTDLLRSPHETLEIEIKNWLDIENNAEHRATLASELIALANHGGGSVIIGLDETDTGALVPATPRPTNLAAYTADAVNGIVHRYAEPPFHCDVSVVTSPTTGLDHPIISIPGGHRVPIRSKRAGPNERGIQVDRYYIRRPGPSSEPPRSGQEWDELIRRCITNGRNDLINQFRIIMAGGSGTAAPENDVSRVNDWFKESMERWHEVTAALPTENPIRLPRGHYAVAYQVVGDFEPQHGATLLTTLRRGEVRHSGWPPFWVPSREGITPYPYDGKVECWLGSDGTERDPAHADFWRVSPDGRFFLIRGYQEDSADTRENIPPGTYFDIILPTWRVGEFLLHAASMARDLGGDETRVVLVVEWTGLANRRLASLGNRMRFMTGTYRARQDAYRTSLEIQSRQIEGSLPELVDRLVRPLYDLFDFFPLPPTLVAEELARMRSHRF